MFKNTQATQRDCLATISYLNNIRFSTPTTWPVGGPHVECWDDFSERVIPLWNTSTCKKITKFQEQLHLNIPRPATIRSVFSHTYMYMLKIMAVLF